MADQHTAGVVPVNGPAPSVSAAKALGADRFGWGTFKKRLMEALGVPPEQFDTWVVPPAWQEVFRKANGR